MKDLELVVIRDFNSEGMGWCVWRVNGVLVGAWEDFKINNPSELEISCDRECFDYFLECEEDFKKEQLKEMLA